SRRSAALGGWDSDERDWMVLTRTPPGEGGGKSRADWGAAQPREKQGGPKPGQNRAKAGQCGRGRRCVWQAPTEDRKVPAAVSSDESARRDRRDAPPPPQAPPLGP